MSANSADLKQSAKNILNSIAVEDNTLSDILDLEGDIIRKARRGSDNLNDFVAVNESVNKVVKNLNKMQMLLQYKHENAGDIMQKFENFRQNDEMEE